MKRMLIVAALSLMAVGQVQAQDEQTDESREAKRTELIAKSGERLAKSFSLEGEGKFPRYLCRISEGDVCHQRAS